jgi:hypothetical protein
MKLLRLLCLAGAITSTVNATTIVYDNNSESSAGADGVDFFGPLYDLFTSTAAQPIVGLQLILSDDGTHDSSGVVDVGLYANDASTPGALMAVVGSVSDGQLSDTPEIYNVNLTGYPLLCEDTSYWIGLSGTTTAEWYYDWDSDGVGVSGGFFSNQFGTFSNIDDPYQMSVTQGISEEGEVATGPEPSSRVLVFLGAVFLVLVRLPARERACSHSSPKSRLAAFQQHKPDAHGFAGVVGIAGTPSAIEPKHA